MGHATAATSGPRSILFGHPPRSGRALRRLAVGALLVTALGLVLGTLVERSTPLGVEEDVLAAVAAERTEGMTAFLRLVSRIGHLQVFLPLTVVAIPLLRRLTRGWAAVWLLLLAFLGSLAITAVVKVVVGRERPLDALVDASSAAFPSGHAARAAAVLGLGMWAVTAVVRRRSVRALLLGLLVGGVLLMGWSRLYLGVHWPSDVLFGYAVGTWWVLVLVHAVRPRVVPAAAVTPRPLPRRPPRRRRPPGPPRRPRPGPPPPDRPT